MTNIERIFITKTPMALFLKKAKTMYLHGFEGLPLYDVIKFFYSQIKTQSLGERASAIAYNFVMAVPPSLLFLFTLIPHMPFVSPKKIKPQLHRIIFDVIPNPIYNREVIKFVDSFLEGAKIGLLSFGFLLALFFASNAVMGIMRSFNKKYVGFLRRKGLQKRWTAIKLTLLLFALLFIYLVLLISQGAILNVLVDDSGWKKVILYSRWLFIIMLIFCVIGFIFRYAPAVQKKWKFNTPGVILATFLCILSSLGFSAYVNDFGSYNALYGSIGTIMMVMALIYINSLALLLGFELNVSIKTLKAKHDHSLKTHHDKKTVPL